MVDNAPPGQINWHVSNIDIGVVKYPVAPVAVFNKVSDRSISSVQVSCPCLTTRLTDTSLVVTWKPRLPENNFYTARKSVIIKYVDGLRDVLTISATFTK